MKPLQKQTRKLDRVDPLWKYRYLFSFDDKSMIYLDGNSLGKPPNSTVRAVRQTVEHQWESRLIRGWNEGWYDAGSVLGETLAPIIGAGPNEVIFSDSTSVNLYKLAYSAMKLQRGKTRIVTDALNFPTDIYILQGLIKSLGEQYSLYICPSRDGIEIDLNDLERTVDDNTALVLLSHTAFTSAFTYDMQEVSDLVHRKGAMILWDLSHSAGVVPVELSRTKSDLAAGCSYKYLNGGPGAPAFLYVREDLQQQLESPIWGWFGDSSPFTFSREYQPADGIRRFLAGTPPVLSLSALQPALEMIREAGIEALREKSMKQTEFLISTAEKLLLPLGCTIGSPREAHKRGSHVSIRHPEAYRICRALIEPKPGIPAFIPDFREPDNIRIGIAPLYNTFDHLGQVTERIVKILKRQEYKNHSTLKDGVT